MGEERAQTDRIVVGIDGSKASRNSVRWAAEEARIHRTSLIITHIESPDATDGAQPSAAGGLIALLELSAVNASHQVPGVAVGTTLLRGSVTDELIGLSRSSALLVLGLDLERSRATHGALGPIEDRVVAHSKCPVVTISGAFRAVGRSGPVVVGWTDSKSGHRALATAAVEAETRRAVLVMVTVASRRQTSEDPAEGRQIHQQALAEAQDLIRDRHPDLALDVVQAGGDVSQALIRHSLNAELLVVGCHHTEDPWGFRTGPVAEAVMRQAGCPVMLVGRLAAGRRGAAESPPHRRNGTELTPQWLPKSDPSTQPSRWR